MNVKIIITNGIVTSVLADVDLNVEVIDIDDDYDDHEALKQYEAEVLQDASLKELNHTTAHF